jgi:hypothetical protein
MRAQKINLSASPSDHGKVNTNLKQIFDFSVAVKILPPLPVRHWRKCERPEK